MTQTWRGEARNDSAAAEAWRGFRGRSWRDTVNPRQFLQDNYTSYDGDSSVLAGATDRTTALWAKMTELFPRERERGVYDVDAHTPASITAHAPGYITGRPSRSWGCRPTPR